MPRGILLQVDEAVTNGFARKLVILDKMIKLHRADKTSFWDLSPENKKLVLQKLVTGQLTKNKADATPFLAEVRALLDQQRLVPGGQTQTSAAPPPPASAPLETLQHPSETLAAVPPPAASEHNGEAAQSSRIRRRSDHSDEGREAVRRRNNTISSEDPDEEGPPAVLSVAALTAAAMAATNDTAAPPLAEQRQEARRVPPQRTSGGSEPEGAPVAHPEPRRTGRQRQPPVRFAPGPEGRRRQADEEEEEEEMEGEFHHYDPARAFGDDVPPSVAPPSNELGFFSLVLQSLLDPSTMEYTDAAHVEVCTICQNPVLSNQKKFPVFITPCQHFFHLYCISAFGAQTGNHRCPNCKQHELNGEVVLKSLFVRLSPVH